MHIANSFLESLGALTCLHQSESLQGAISCGAGPSAGSLTFPAALGAVGKPLYKSEFTLKPHCFVFLKSISQVFFL